MAKEGMTDGERLVHIQTRMDEICNDLKEIEGKMPKHNLESRVSHMKASLTMVTRLLYGAIGIAATSMLGHFWMMMRRAEC